MALVTTQGDGKGSVMNLSDDQVRDSLASLCLRGDSTSIVAVLEEAPDRARTMLSGRLDADGYAGLHFAASTGHLELARALLAHQCDANMRDKRLQTPLHLASSEGHAKVALELVTSKCDIDAGDEDQRTALHRAALSSSEVVKVLLDHGAKNAPDNTRSTPLLLAAGHGRTEQMALLLAKDPAQVHLANECGWTALHLAAHGKELKKSSVIGAKFLPAVRLLLEAMARVDSLDEDSRTPLHRAAATGNTETVGALLAAKADATAADMSRWTPLHFASQDGHVDVARQLLDARAELQSTVCLTPLALATMENQVKVAELLVQRKADPDLRAKGLASAAMVARKDPEKFNEILSLFELGFIRHPA